MNQLFHLYIEKEKDRIFSLNIDILIVHTF